MNPEEKEKLNSLFEFLNGLGGQISDSIKKNGKEDTISLVMELRDAIDGLKEDISFELKKNTPDFSKLSITPQFKFPDIKITKFPEKIEFPKIEFPEFPDKISLNEAADITDLLNKIIQEVKKKDLDINLGEVEGEIIELKNKISEEFEKLRKSLPTIPVFPELPIEKGRIKVILPDDQVQLRTSLGEKIRRVVTPFWSGSTVQAVRITDKSNVEINPATKENQESLIASYGKSSQIGTGNKTVITTGVAVQLSSSSILCRRVIVHAAGNHIVVGDSDVVYAEATRKGVWLAKTQREVFYVNDVSLLWIDAAVDNTLVSFYYEK